MAKYFELSQLRFQATKSSGPGGQNVNKNNTAVHMYWDFNASATLNPDQKKRISDKLTNLINSQGELRLYSSKHKSLDKNKKACIEKLKMLLNMAFQVQKKRKKTKPTKANKRKRLENKKKRGEIKQNRKKIKL